MSAGFLLGLGLVGAGALMPAAPAGAAPAPTSLSTSLADGNGQSGTTVRVPGGGQVTDTATLTGANASTASGTMTFAVYSDSACTVEVGSPDVQTMTGATVSSLPVTLSTSGTYYWTASYIGDSNNAASSSTCGSEVEIVSTVTPESGSSGALAIAQAMASTTTNVTGASFVTTPPNNQPNGISSSTMAGFPTAGSSSYGILTSGDVNSVPKPGTFASNADGGGNIRGNTDYDVSILAVNLSVPSAANCLSFNFKFLSEEYPIYVGTSYNDAFIAELDNSTWTTNGSTISAPNNFAFDSSHNVVSINSTGVGGLSPTNGYGTAFDGTTENPTGDSNGGATVLLSAATQVTPGAHTLYLSIFDQGDQVLDSAAFVDNLSVGFVPNPAVNCVSGAQVQNYGLTLTPKTGGQNVGSPYSVTAHLVDQSGTAVANAPIIFTASGVNSATGTVNTDSSGNATFTYTGTTAGLDQINACYQPSTSSSCLATTDASVTWNSTVTPTTLKVAAGGTGDFADKTSVSATLTNTNTSAGIAGKSVTLTLNGAETCSGTTDSSGTATCTITPGEPAGTYTLAGSFAGDSTDAAASATANFTVTHEETALSYTGATSVLNGGSLAVSGVLTTDDPALNTGLGGKQVTFTLGSGLTAQGCSATTASDGTASCSISGVNQTVGTVSLSDSFAGDNFYVAASNSANVSVFQPTALGAFVVGDLSAKTGANVNFWGAQWAKNNKFSGGAAPSSMKGFADSPTSLTCGATWTTRTGDSSAPPATISGTIEVIVSKKVTQSGSVISGTVAHIVTVQVNSGYAPNPGHAGNGKVVGTVC